jgi:hypothetical protein
LKFSDEENEDFILINDPRIAKAELLALINREDAFLSNIFLI